MSGEDKAAAMADFASGATPVLLATTVIEVGVDVPEASMMVVLDADRFGLSQLHQLRGRVGRGGRESICVAVTGVEVGSTAFHRLKAFASTMDGFALAEADLDLRSRGEPPGWICCALPAMPGSSPPPGARRSGSWRPTRSCASTGPWPRRSPNASTRSPGPSSKERDGPESERLGEPERCLAVALVCESPQSLRPRGLR